MKRALPITGLLLLCLATSFADPAAAIATAVGEAFLNGNALIHSSAVLDGDRLSTGRSAALILHLAGSSIHIGPDSAARFRGTTLELLSGSAEVQGRESIVAGSYALSPADEAHFAVQHQPTLVSLRLLRGSLKLSRGTQLQTLTAPGQYSFPDDAPATAMKPHAITKAIPAAAGTAAGASVIIAHWLSGKDAAASTACVSGKSPTSCK